MKTVLINAILTVCLAIFFSSCSEKGPSDEVSQNGEANAENAKPKSAYPPIAEKIAQGEMTNLDNTTSKIADRKGKVVLLNMWATWCGPCRSEMPTLVRLQENLGREDLEIIGLNVDDETIDLINEFAAEMKLNYTLVWPSREMQMELLKVSKFTGIPQSFLIDRDGNLRGVFRGANPADIRKMEQLVTKVVAE